MNIWSAQQRKKNANTIAEKWRGNDLNGFLANPTPRMIPIPAVTRTLTRLLLGLYFNANSVR